MSLDADCGRMTGNRPTAVFVRVPLGDEIRPIIRPWPSLRYDLGAPPTASQVFATGMAAQDEPCSNVGIVGGQTLARSYST